MTPTKTFHIGDVLSAMTGILVSPDHIDGVYRILNWMTGDNLFTHQLPRAADECAPSLRAQFPDLAAIDIPDFADADAVHAWLDQQVAAHGETRDVTPLAAGDHTVIDPISEMRMIRPDVQVITVEVDEP